MDKPREKCGLMAAYGIDNASEVTFLGLYALQHRGQESAGITSVEEGQFHSHRGMGLVADIFSEEVLGGLRGSIAIGHNRYSTTGSSTLTNAQPIVARFKGGHLAVAHNGNFVNSYSLRTELEQEGAIFQSTMDTEVIVHLIARSRAEDLRAQVGEALAHVRGAHSLLILVNDILFAARDPLGFRPLSIGRLGEGYVVGSETCAFDLVGASMIRDVKPGEVVMFSPGGMESFTPVPSTEEAECIFEYVYFARPDSLLFGHSTDAVRRELGRRLSRECPVEADCVISVPDSSNAHALGFSEQSGIPLEIGLIRNHYVGRTFILPSQDVRHLKARIKYNPVREVLAGRRVCVVDDSLVRGTTSKALVQMMRHAGAAEIHLRIASPPLTHPCYYGIDMPTKEELIGGRKTVEEIREYLSVDSLGYLSLEGMLAAAPQASERYCTACFSGQYRVPLEDLLGKHVLEEPHAAPHPA